MIHDPPELLDALVRSYQQGSRAAGEELLRHFTPFIGKFIRLLRSGDFSPLDAELLNFLYLCGKTDPVHTAELLAYRLRAVPKEDLEQECRVAFLETAIACRYLSGNYKFYLKPRVFALIEAEIPTVDLLAAEELIGYPYLSADPDIDEDWVAGDTSDLFAGLSVEERRLVRALWHLKLSEEALCAQFDLSRTALKRRKTELKRKVAALLGRRA